MSKKIIQYVRVSTEGQNTEIQEANIVMGAQVYKDKTSGDIPFKERDFVKHGMIDEIEEGLVKELHVYSIDRLGRDTLDVLSTIKWLTDNGVNLIAQKESVRTLNDDGTENPYSKMIIGILATMAEMELNRIRTRRREGIENAKKKGVYKSNGGNKKVESIYEFLLKPLSKKIVKELNNGESVRRTANLCNCSTGSVQKVKRSIEIMKLDAELQEKIFTQTRRNMWDNLI